jgi:hypothetical protein
MYTVTTRTIKSRRMGRREYVARMGRKKITEFDLESSRK